MPNDLRICFFGDSFVNGTGDEVYQGWPGRVSARLHAQGLPATVYNLGIRRDTSGDVLARWRAEAGRRLPDHVDGRLVFSFGVNDCVEEAGQRRVAGADSLRNAERIFTEAAAWKPTFVIGPPATCMADQPGIAERVQAVSAELRDLCAALRVPFVDLYGPLSDQPVWKQEVAAGDGVHPVGAGYERIAEIVLTSPIWRGWLSPGTARRT